MFKLLERKDAASAEETEIGPRHATREQALSAIRKHLKTFKVSGHNPEKDYWWARNSEGLRKCWIVRVE